MLSSCIFSSSPNKDSQPEVKGDPELVHTGITEILTPGIVSQESLYVKNAKPQDWTLALLSSPQGTSLVSGKITYNIVADLDGPQEVHAIAADGLGKILDLKWTVVASPLANQDPVITYPDLPQWIVAGKTFRTVVRIVDPEGDSMFYYNRLPKGAIYRDSVFEWTPTMDQLGNNQVVFDVSDQKKNHRAIAFDLHVRRLDPKPFTADISTGRSWWIHSDSIETNGNPSLISGLKRRITITANDPGTGYFEFLVSDTLQIGGKDSTSETLFSASSIEGWGFSMRWKSGGTGTIPFEESLPFHWPGEEQIFEYTTIEVQGKAYSALRQIMANNCNKYFCYNYEFYYVSGLGRVSEKSDGSTFIPASTNSSAFKVWATSGP